MILTQLEEKARKHQLEKGKQSDFIAALYKRICIRLLQRRDYTMRVADLMKTISTASPFNVITYGTVLDAKLAPVANEIFAASDAQSKKLASSFIVPSEYF